MDFTSSWDFTLANYGPVWSFMVQFGLLLLFLVLGNTLRRTIPLFRKCLVPSALLGGTLLMLCNILSKQFGFILVDNRLMQVITYHCLAIGFAAMSLKTEKSTHKTKPSQVLEFGALQGGTYMLQAFVGLGITLILFLLTRYGNQVISYVCGLVLPLGFGQGPGNALSWDINYTNTPPPSLPATAASVSPWHPSALWLHPSSVCCTSISIRSAVISGSGTADPQARSWIRPTPTATRSRTTNP